MLYLLLFLPLALILVAFQSTILNQMPISGGHFDILTIFLVLLTLYVSWEPALLAVVLIAPMVDAISGYPLGASIIPMLSIVLMAHWGSKTIFGDRLGWPILVIFLGILISGLILILELVLLGWRLPWDELILRVLIPTAFLNGLAALAIYIPIVLVRERQDLRLH